VPKTYNVGVQYMRGVSTTGLPAFDHATGDPLVIRQGIDFEVTPDGKLDFSLMFSAAPNPKIGAGEWYTISYYTHPRYVVVGWPYVRRVTWNAIKAPQPARMDLPCSALARLEWIP